MTKGNFSMFGLIAISLALVIVLIVGCAAPTATPTTPTTSTVVKPSKFTLYAIVDMSGASAVTTVPEVNGIKYYLEWLNANKGGIRGVPVEFVFEDNAYKLEKTIPIYSKFREMQPKPALLFTTASFDTEALRDRVIEDTICNYAQGNTPSGLYPVGYSISIVPSYPDMIGGFMDWVTSDWSKKTGAPVKLAILTWNSSLGKAVLTDEMRAYAKQKGIQLVAEELFNPSDLDVTTQLTKIQAAGANWVYDNGAAVTAIVINKSATAMGIMNHNLYDTTPGKIHHSTNQNQMTQQVLAPALKESEGMIGPMWLSSMDETDKPGVKLTTQIADKYNMKPIERNNTLLAGVGFGDIMAEIIGKTVDAVGWDKVNGTTVKDTILNLKNYTPPTTALYTFNYSSNKPEPNQGRILQLKDGNVSVLSPWYNCPDLAPAKR